MAIEKTIGRTPAGGPKKIPETTAELLQLGFYLGPGCQTGFTMAKVITLTLLVGFAALGGAVLLLMIAII
jgi:hypothetical protein